MVRVFWLGVLTACVLAGFVVGVASLLRYRLNGSDPNPTVPSPDAPREVVSTRPAEDRPAPAVPIVLTAAEAKVHGSELRLETDPAKPDRILGAWRNPDDFAEWTVEPRRAGAYDVLITYACDSGEAGGDFLVMAGPAMLRGRSVSTGGWFSFQTVAVGTADLPQQRTSLILRAAPGFPRGRFLMNFHSLRLVPQGYVEPPPAATANVIELPAAAAALNGAGLSLQPDGAGIGGWSQEYQSANWALKLPAAGRYDVEIEYACGPDAGGDFLADFGEDKLFARSEPTGSWQEFKTVPIGSVYLTPATARLTIRPVGTPRQSLMNLRSVRLVPAK